MYNTIFFFLAVCNMIFTFYFRCFCLAEEHGALAKWNKANVLYDRAIERISNTLLLLKNAEGNPFIAEKKVIVLPYISLEIFIATVPSDFA